MKRPYSIALSQVARAINALGLGVGELMGEDHRELNGNIGKVAETVLLENNDKSRKAMSSFVKRYHTQLFSSLINIQKEDATEFPPHIQKTAKNLLKLSEDPEEISKASWRIVNSIFGNLCQLEQISKRNAANRKKMYNLWISNDGLLRACYDSLLLKKKVRPSDEMYTIDSCSSTDDDEIQEDINRRTHPIGFADCVIKVGSIVVEQPLLLLMEESKDSLNLTVKDLCEVLCQGCVVNINRVNYNKGDSPRVTGYAYCSHSSCRLYKFMISLTSKKVATFTLLCDKMSTRHKGKLTRPLKGLERKMEKKDLEHIHPYTHRMNAANKCDAEVALKGNLQGVRKLPVFRKARSEVLAQDDHHKNDIMDIMLMMDMPEYENYIQSVGKPFHVYLWSPNMHKVALKVSKKGVPCNYLYLDATGSVVKSQNKKQVYLYGGSFTAGGEIYPAFDFLLSSQKTDDISLPLISYRRSVLDTVGRWPLFPLVVTDDSMALRSAVSLAWNSMPLSRYIDQAYEWMKKGVVPSEMVVLAGCISHFSKRVCKGASKFAEKGSTLRKFMVESFLTLLQFKDFDSMMQAFRHICIIFNCENRTPLLRTSLEALQVTISGNVVKEEEFNPTEDEDDNENLWEGSALVVHLKELTKQELQQIGMQTDVSKEKNPFFSPSWFDYMLKTFAPKIVFNSAIFLAGDLVSISNQLQENSHRILKVVLLKNERKKKPGRFIRLQKKRSDSLIKLHDLRLGRKPVIKNKNLASFEEKFKKRLRNKTAHTSLKAVKKIDLSLISAKVVKKYQSKKATVVKTRKRAANWKFEMSDDEGKSKTKPPPPKTQKHTNPISSTQTSSISSGTIKDLLAEYGSEDYPIIWTKTHRFFQNSEINHDSLHLVVSGEWLNDEIINAFLHLRLSLTPDHPKKFLLFNTHHTGYTPRGLGVSANNFIRNMRPCRFDVWLIPANVGSNHWALFVVLPRQKILLYLDSMNMSATSEFTKVTSIIQYSLQIDDEDATLEDWVAIRCTDLVQQNNGSDCGVFLCLFAHVVASGTPLKLQPDDGKLGRVWLVWELCHNDEPKNVARAPWEQIGKLASDRLPDSLMAIKKWDRNESSMNILSQILSKAHEPSFRDDIV